MLNVEDWAEVQRLFHREHLTKRAIARRLGMSRTTVIRLLALKEPPAYVRAPATSLLDPYRDEVAALLAADPAIAAPGSGLLDVFVTGTDTGLWHKAINIY